MPKGPLDDLLPSPDEIMFMGEDLSAILELAGQSEAVVAFSAPAMTWWGGTMALASVAFILRFLDLLPAWLPISLIQAAAGFGGTLATMYLDSRKITFSAWQSRAVRIIWFFGAAAIFLFNLGCALTHVDNIMLLNGFLCLIFGVTTGSLGSLRRREWLLVPATGWLAAGFAEFFLNDVVIRQTVLGLAALCFMAVPGLVMMVGRKNA